MPSKQKNEGKEILLLDFELFIGGLNMIDQLCQIIQNKANFKNSQMYVSLNISRDYEKILQWTLGENKPKQSQFKFYRRERCVRR